MCVCVCVCVYVYMYIIVRRGVKTLPFQKQPPHFWVTPPFLKIPEPLPQPPPLSR